MTEYQRQAVELAMLHDRVMRGHAPPDAAERGRLMAHRLAVLRAHLASAQLGGARHRHAEVRW